MAQFDLWNVPKNDRACDLFYRHLRTRFTDANNTVDYEQLYFYIREALVLVFNKSAQLFTFNAIFIAIAIILLKKDSPYLGLLFIPIAGYFLSCAVNSTIMFVRFNPNVAGYASWQNDCDWNVDHIAKRARRLNMSIVISIFSTVFLIALLIASYTHVLDVLPRIPGSTAP